MKKVIFAGIFLLYTLFPFHIIYEEKLTNTVVLNGSAKLNYIENQYILLMDRKSSEISVCKDKKVLKKLSFQGKLENSISSTIESKGVILLSTNIDNKPKYYIEIFPNYIISSVPIGEKGTIIEDGKNIIVTDEDVKWIYDTIPVGTEINER